MVSCGAFRSWCDKLDRNTLVYLEWFNRFFIKLKSNFLINFNCFLFCFVFFIKLFVDRDLKNALLKITKILDNVKIILSDYLK